VIPRKEPIPESEFLPYDKGRIGVGSQVWLVIEASVQDVMDHPAQKGDVGAGAKGHIDIDDAPAAAMPVISMNCRRSTFMNLPSCPVRGTPSRTPGSIVWQTVKLSGEIPISCSGATTLKRVRQEQERTVVMGGDNRAHPAHDGPPGPDDAWSWVCGSPPGVRIGLSSPRPFFRSYRYRQ